MFGTALLAAAGWAGAALLVARADSNFARRLDAGCDEIEPCRVLEAEAERRMDGCSLFCGRVAAEYGAARRMRFRAEERRAVHDHYLERERAEGLERQARRARQLDEWQRQAAVRADEAARERAHQLELERLRRAHADRRLAEERDRRQKYYAALSAEGRAQRLKHCRSSHERCDALVLDLLDAARSDAERRKLAELNEGIEQAPPKHEKRAASPSPAPSHGSPAASEPAGAAPAAEPEDPGPSDGYDAEAAVRPTPAPSILTLAAPSS